MSDKDERKLTAIDGGRLDDSSAQDEPFGPPPPLSLFSEFGPPRHQAVRPLTPAEIEASRKLQAELEASRKLQEAKLKRDMWAIERREFWKTIVVQTVIGVGSQAALRPMIEAMAPDRVEPIKPNYAEAKAAADLALKWFDEAFGHEFPADDLIGRPLKGTL